MDEISKSIMEGNLLLASAALFRSLHNDNMDQQDILAKFITASIHLNNMQVFDARTLAKTMNRDFGFDIPEAVIRNCIRKKLKNSFCSTGVGRNQFQLTEEFEAPPEIEAQFRHAQKTQDALTQKLVRYVEALSDAPLGQKDRDLLVHDFYEYVKGNTRPSANATHIALFILGIKEQADLDVLEQTKQGLIIYEGLRYNADGSGATLNNDLLIYLDTEVIFSAAGLHGQMRRDIFLDLYNLVRDVNRKPVKNSPGKIKFRYFGETRVEIEKYFGSARAIVDKKERLNPTRDAMVNIVSGCGSRTDVLDKEAAFWIRLEQLGIEKDEERGYFDDHGFNIESVDSRAEVARELGWDEDSAGQILSKFSKINYLRKGRNEPPVESIGAIIVSGKNAMRQSSFMSHLYLNTDRFIPYSTDLEFITTWLWSKLGKAFGPNQATPIAFTIVNRTRVVLSSQLGARIGEEYDRLRAEITDKSVGEARKEEIARALARLKSIKVSPEEVGKDGVDLAFLFEDDLVARAADEHLALTEQVKLAEQAKRERSKEQQDARILQDELDALRERNQKQEAALRVAERLADKIARKKSTGPEFNAVKRQMFCVRFGYWTLLPLGTVLLVQKLASPPDTALGILGTAAGTLVPLVGMLWAFRGKLNQLCLGMKWRRARSWKIRTRLEPTLKAVPNEAQV